MTDLASLDRRTFLKAGLATGAALGAGPAAMARALGQLEAGSPIHPPARADAMILIWLPGGIAQTDTWDPKRHTPFAPGMRASELLGTCPAIPTSADGVFLGAGLENMASVMHEGTILRTLTNTTMFGAIHLKAQYYMMTGYLFPAGVKAPSLGAAVARTLGRREPSVPPYIYIGRDIDTSDEERLFISEYIGPGFYGVAHAPFMIPDPEGGMDTLEAAAGIDRERLDRRQRLLLGLRRAGPAELRDSPRAQDYVKMMEDARAMMDSPVRRAFDLSDERPETLAAYAPEIGPDEVADRSYYNGRRFARGLLLARRLVERGARFVQVEYQYGPFKGFDMHENGWSRMVEMKRQIDRPIARLVRDLRERGLLDRTLVVIATEFGRTIAAAPSAGTEPDGFAERQTGENLVLEHEGMFGFHGHFSSCNCVLFFGGGFKRGHAHGRTAADRHPMVAVEDPVTLEDVHATIYTAMGISPETSYITEGRPFYVTKDGKGRAIEALLA